MNIYKDLHKTNSPSYVNEMRKINRERHRESRLQKRKDTYFNNRAIPSSPSPKEIRAQGELAASPLIIEKLVTTKNDAVVKKENITPRIALVAGSNKSESLTRQDQYLKRFVKWRKAKKEEISKSQFKSNIIWKPYGKIDNKAVSHSVGTSFGQNSRKFCPPQGLIKPNLIAGTQLTNADEKSELRKRHSFYVPVKEPLKLKAIDPTKTDSQFRTDKSNNILCQNQQNLGAISKAKQSQRLRNNMNAADYPKIFKLSKQLKAKKPTTNCAIESIKSAAADFKRPMILKKKLQPQTPTLSIHENPLVKFVTSTQVKTLGSNLNLKSFFNEISPLELNETNHTETSKGFAKIKNLHAAGLHFKFPETKLESKKGGLPNHTLIELQKSDREDLMQVQTVCHQQNVSIPNTPKLAGNSKDNDRPINYLSPYVSVSRGKVNARVEKDRRNSKYLGADNEESPEKSSAEEMKKTTVMNSVKVRRTLESIRYFRQQLQNETSRLRTLCKQWEEYKLKHIKRLQEMNCDDKIDATIGQTLLLTDNKFQQFNGLINRCEEYAIGVAKVCIDGNEDTKLVEATDLEGFWAMLGLQIDNVEKRFREIECWKSNDWCDPDALKTKSTEYQKPNLTKVSKSKAKSKTVNSKPSSGLQELMRTELAKMKTLKAAKAEVSAASLVANTINNNKSSNLEPSGSSLLVKTQKRTSIIVPNRKMFSHARTVLSFIKRPSPHNRRDSRVNSVDGALCTKSSNSLERVLPKSILKTPGTEKAKRNSVLFSAKKLVRKYKLTFNEPNSSDEDGDANNLELGNRGHDVVKDYVVDTTHDSKEESSEYNTIANNDYCQGQQPNQDYYHEDNLDFQDESNRPVYVLRSRSVKLRPSSDFVIPR